MNSMSPTVYALINILLLSLLSIGARALPFVFSKILRKSAAMKMVGKYLPAHLMLLLLVYEVDIETFSKPPYGIPTILGLSVVFILHIWRRNTFLSIIAGTATFILTTMYLHHT